MRRSVAVPAVAAGLAAALLAGCSSGSGPGGPAAAAPPSAATSPVSGAAAVATATVPLTLAKGVAADKPFDATKQVSVPAGWTASVWARVDGARLAAWTPQGDLLISRPGAGVVTRLRPASDPAAKPASTDVLTGLDQPHGLAFDGSTLYVAESNEVVSYAWRPDGTAGARKVVVAGLPDSKSPELGGQYAHALKSVAVGPDHAVYVMVGSTGNVSPRDRSADPQRAAVLRVPPGGGRATVFARGVRNGEGLSFAPDGTLWVAVNNRDNIEYPYDRAYGDDKGSDLGKVVQSYVNDHPSEEVARLTAGRDLGWPYCDPDPDVQPGVAGTALAYRTPRYVRDQELNADGSKLDCSTLKPIEYGIPAHSAPIGMTFLTGSKLPATWANGVVVALHGSWNRTPPRAPTLTWFPWNAAGRTLGAPVTLLDGLQNADGSRWGRLADAVPGPDGALYATDDTAGAVYRLVPPKA